MKPETDEILLFAAENRRLLDDFLAQTPSADPAEALKIYARAVMLWHRRYQDSDFDFPAFLFWRLRHKLYIKNFQRQPAAELKKEDIMNYTPDVDNEIIRRRQDGESLSAIVEALGLTSVASLKGHIVRLREKGLIPPSNRKDARRPAQADTAPKISPVQIQTMITPQELPAATAAHTAPAPPAVIKLVQEQLQSLLNIRTRITGEISELESWLKQEGGE